MTRFKVGDYVRLTKDRQTTIDGIVKKDTIFYIYNIVDEYTVNLKWGDERGKIFDPNVRGNDLWGMNDGLFELTSTPRQVEIIRFTKDLK